MSSPISTILANLRRTVNILRSAVYAIDVRDDIADAIDDSADAIEQIYSDVDSASLREDAFAAALQEAIDDNLLPIPATVIDDNSLPGTKIQDGTIPLRKLSEAVQITVDSALSGTSTNPVQNKVIKETIDELNGSLGDTSDALLRLEIASDLGDEELNSRVTDVEENMDSFTSEKGALIDDINRKKINLPVDGNSNPTYGTSGKVLRSLGNNRTEWVDLGQPTDAQVEEVFSDWLDNHPEATTTVLDGSLTLGKFVNGSLGYVTPQMFGAVADGEHDDKDAINAMYTYASANGQIVVFPKGDYMTSVSIAVKSNTTTICSPKATFTTVSVHPILASSIVASYVFAIQYVENAIIYFNGAVIDGKNARSHAINIVCSHRVTIYDVYIDGVATDSNSSSSAHDGIYIGTDSSDINIIRGYITMITRNGISVCDADNVIIDGLIIHHVGWIPTSWNPDRYIGNSWCGIDVEPNYKGKGHNVLIQNCKVSHCQGTGLCISAGKYVKLYNNLVDDVSTGILVGQGGVANKEYRVGYEILYIKSYDAETGFITVEAEEDADLSIFESAVVNLGSDSEVDTAPNELYKNGDPSQGLIANFRINAVKEEIVDDTRVRSIRLTTGTGTGLSTYDPGVITSFTNAPANPQHSYIKVVNSDYTSEVVIEKNKITNVAPSATTPNGQTFGIDCRNVRTILLKNNTIDGFVGNTAINVWSNEGRLEGNKLLNINGSQTISFSGIMGSLIDTVIRNATAYPMYLTGKIMYVDGLIAENVSQRDNIKTLMIFAGSAKCRYSINNAYFHSSTPKEYGISKGVHDIKLRNVIVDCECTKGKYQYFTSADMDFCI